MARTVSSGACRAVSVPAAARTGLRDKAIGRRSWLCCPGLPRYGARRAQPWSRRPSGPRGLGAAPSWHATRARAVPLPLSSGLARQGQAVWSTSACAVADRGVGGAWVCSRRSGSSQLRLASVFVVPLAVASWGVVPLAERRSRACRWSRGRRPSRSDNEARDRRATLPQRHPSGAGGPLSQTQPRRACRLQRPCSPLIVRRRRG
jgi:hypothetical protein